MTSPPSPRTPRLPRIADVRGVARLAVDGVHGVTHIAQGLHGSIASLAPAWSGKPARPAGGIAGFVYGTVRATSSAVGMGVDAALALAESLLARGPATDDGSSNPASRGALVAALNGVLGDHLERTGNPLATTMTLLPDRVTGPDVVVLVHGLCMSDSQWLRDGHDHGAALAADLGITPLYLRYNTGRHVSTNGVEFASLLEERLSNAQVPVRNLVLIGHSMGGLVARSALHAAREAGMAWPRRLRAMIFLGTPHHGAPLERSGNWLHRALGVSPYVAPFARLAGLRSDGITDLRHGNLLESDWASGRYAQRDTRTTVPLPRGIACYAIAGSLGDGPAGLLGDGLVTVDSALGRHARPTRSLKFPAAHTWTAQQANHFDLLRDPRVYARIRDWTKQSIGRLDARRPPQ